MKTITAFVVLIALALASGCGANPKVKSASDPANGFAFGNIVIEDKWVPGNITAYKLGVVYAGPFKAPPRGHTYTDGSFFFENLPPGRYYIASIQTGKEIYSMEGSLESAERVMFDVTPGGVVYVGSFSIDNVKSRMIGTGRFTRNRVNEPDERTILDSLAPHLEGTDWAAPVAAYR